MTDKRAFAPLGRAMVDYFNGEREAVVLVHSNGQDEPDEIKLEVFFRGPDDFDALESTALELCHGRVLDAGAGAGGHSLRLQNSGCEVVALDLLPEAAEVMRRRGVKDARVADLFDLDDNGFDTVLMMMNGIGVVGDFAGLDRFFEKAKGLIKQDGQLVLDSLDMRNEYNRDDGLPWNRLNKSRYPGLTEFRIEYRGKKGRSFNWLFVDPDTLAARAQEAGWMCQVIFSDEDGRFLARLKML